MPALSISIIAATEGGAKAAAIPTASTSGGGDQSPFAILLAAISQADPDAQPQLASGSQPPIPGTTQTQPGTLQTSQPAKASPDANESVDIAQATAAGANLPGGPIQTAGSLLETPPAASPGPDDTFTSIKVDGKSGKKTAGGKGDDKLASDLPQASAMTPSCPPAPIVPLQTVQVQIVANDNSFADDADPILPVPPQSDGGGRVPATPSIPSPVTGLANADTTGSAQSGTAGGSTQLQEAASLPPTPAANDSDDEGADVDEKAASVPSFAQLQLAPEKFPIANSANGKVAARQSISAPAPQTTTAPPAEPDNFAATDTARTGGPSIIAGASTTPSAAAPPTPEKPDTANNPSPPIGVDGSARPTVPQIVTAADTKPAGQDFSNVPLQTDGKDSSNAKPTHAAATDTAPQLQATQPLPPAQATPSQAPQTIAVTLGGPAPQNGGPGGPSTLPIHVVAHDPDAMAGAAVTAPNTDALAVSIAARSLSGSKQFDIRLDPPELGRVEVRLSIDASGKTEAHMTTDQPQTLALLQKDAPILTRALRDAGLDVSQNGLNFSLKGQGHNPGGQGGNFGAPSRGLSLPALAQSVEALQAGIALPSLLGGARLDIHV